MQSVHLRLAAVVHMSLALFTCAHVHIQRVKSTCSKQGISTIRITPFFYCKKSENNRKFAALQQSVHGV